MKDTAVAEKATGKVGAVVSEMETEKDMLGDTIPQIDGIADCIVLKHLNHVLKMT